MVKKLVLLFGLCVGASLRGMVQEKPSIQDEEIVTILCEGKERRLNKSLAKLSEVLKNGIEDTGTGGIFVVPSVISLSTWDVIQGLLERVHFSDEDDGSYDCRDVHEMLKGLDASMLIHCLVAVDCLNISCLFSSVLQAVDELDVCALSIDQLEIVPLHMRVSIMMNHVINVLGPLVSKVIETYEDQECDDILSESFSKETKMVGGTLHVYAANKTEDMIGKKKLLATCPNHKNRKFIPCVGPDKEVYFSSCFHGHGAFSMWDKEGKDIAVFKGHTEEVACVCWLRDNKIASGSNDGTVRVWDSLTGEQLGVCKGTDNTIFTIFKVCLLPDGNLLAGYQDGTSRIWDVTVGKLLAVCNEAGQGDDINVTGDGNPVSTVSVATRGLLAVLGGAHFLKIKQITRVWDVGLLKHLKGCQEEHIREIWVCLQALALQKKLGTLNASEGWDAIRGILERTEPGLLSRVYGYLKSKIL